MTRRRAWGACVALALALQGCAPPAVVYLNRTYDPNRARRVALIDFRDFPSMQGSGRLTSGIFEKYLLLGDFTVVDPPQVEAAMGQLNLNPSNLDLFSLQRLAMVLRVDAFVMGSVTDFTDASSQTVVEDMPVEQNTPIYTQVNTVQRAPGGWVTTQQNILTGNDITTVDQPVQQTEIVDAHVGLAVRMVDPRSGDVLWSASDSASGAHLNDAAERASANIMAAYRERVKQLDAQAAP